MDTHTHGDGRKREGKWAKGWVEKGGAFGVWLWNKREGEKRTEKEREKGNRKVSFFSSYD